MPKSEPKEPTPEERVAKAAKILIEGLRYAEYDGHNMPKAPVREALDALGVHRDDQP